MSMMSWIYKFCFISVVDLIISNIYVSKEINTERMIVMKKLSNLLVEHNKFCNMVDNIPDCLKEIYARSFEPGIDALEREISSMIDALAVDNVKEKDDPNIFPDR